MPSQQILLQQQTAPNKSSLWSLFGKQGLHKENPETTFQSVIYDLLHVKLPISKIYPIYSYFNKEINKDHVVVYAEVAALRNFTLPKTIKCAWFTLKQTHKLQLPEQTKHDIIIGQRVIDARMRKSLGLLTLE